MAPEGKVLTKALGLFEKMGLRKLMRKVLPLAKKEVDNPAIRDAVEDAAKVGTRHDLEHEATKATERATKELSELYKNGRIPNRKELEEFAERQGWHRTQTPNGPVKYVDETGTPRLTVKTGSSRAPGSGNPHIEIKDHHGTRLDPQGNPVTRKSPGNHSPFDDS